MRNLKIKFWNKVMTRVLKINILMFWAEFKILSANISQKLWMSFTSCLQDHLINQTKSLVKIKDFSCLMEQTWIYSIKKLFLLKAGLHQITQNSMAINSKEKKF